MDDDSGFSAPSFTFLAILGVMAVVAFGYFFFRHKKIVENNNIDYRSESYSGLDEARAPDTVTSVEESTSLTIDEELLNMDDLDEDQKRTIALQPEILREKIAYLDMENKDYCMQLIKIFPNEEDTWYNFSVSEYFGVNIDRYYNEINFRIKEIETDGETNLSLKDLLYAKAIARVYYNNYVASCIK